MGRLYKLFTITGGGPMGAINAYAAFSREPIDVDWPQSDLESLGACPVCGSKDRTPAYSNLRDRVFFCAPGTWTLWECGYCSVGYLDPRPTIDSIGKAYSVYYTHPKKDTNLVSEFLPQLRASIKRDLRNSYLNKKHNFRLKALIPLGWAAYELVSAHAACVSMEIRHLPKPDCAHNRLLDVGCGNGEFLKIARELGYDAEGLEIDSNARDAACRNGITIYLGRMPGSGLRPSNYDYITLNHVVEHFHDPKAALAEVFTLLRPRGHVWIQVPNLAAFSLRRFGIHSRLLEPPRHIVMFNEKSLGTLLAEIGFREITILRSREFEDKENSFIDSQSWMIEQGLDPYATPFSTVPRELQSFSATASLGVGEPPVVTIIAVKP
jgi:2-polyprenyl-3-methyl-5-hydroxy-6-metoxy-1,4-benzoquinol methylase